MRWLCLRLGKTSSLVYAVLYAVKLLLGKKDKEGNNPRIMVCSKTITFLSKTWTTKFEQVLKATGSSYKYDKAHNIITVGSVEIYLIATEEPENIYGFDVCYCFEENTPIATSKGQVKIKDVKAGDYVLTTQGFKKVKRNIYQGVKDCIEVKIDGKKIICTPEHKFIDIFDNNIEAKDLTKTTSLVKVEDRSYRKWLKENGKTEKNLKLLTSMVSDITAILSQNRTENDVTTPAHMKTSKEVTILCTEICGLLPTEKSLKDILSITKTETILTTLSKTLSCLRKVNTLKDTGLCSRKKKEKCLVKQLKKLRNEIKSFSKITNTENTEENLQNKYRKDYLSNVSVKYAEKPSLLTVLKLNSALKRAGKKLQNNRINVNTRRNKNTELASYAENNSKHSNTLLLKPAHLTVKTSKEVGQFTVYDLEVEDCHEFFANGVRVHNCVVDELDELPTGTAMEAVKSINDRVRQQIEGFRSPTLCFATTSQGLKGLYQTVLHFKKSGIGYVLMRARTCDNTYLPKDYVKNMYTIYNEKERECLLEGKFISIDSGLVFPDYNPEKNLLDYDLYETVRDEMTDETVYIGQDFNTFGNNAIAAVIIDKAVVLIKDYEFPDIRKAPQVFRYDFPTQRIVWIPDMTYKEHFGEFKKELKMHRINIAYRSCNPLVTDRNFAANKLFFTERLFVCPLCKDTENTLLTWQKDPKTGLPSKGGKGAPDHKGDCLGYIVHYLLSWRRELKDIYSVTLGRLYTKRREHGASAAELEASTSILKPEQIRPTLKLPDETPEA